MRSSPDFYDQDVPLTVDHRDADVAAAWVADADVKRPWRAEMRAAIAQLVQGAVPPPRRVLELGPGPGLLAEAILGSCEVDSYTLFDFSPPMLAMCRQRVGHHASVGFVQGDFTRDDWTAALARSYDAVVAMQAVHEIRHKRHVPRLYSQVRELLRPGGLLAVCDHTPPDHSARLTALHSTVDEQHAALASAGLVCVTTHLDLRGLYLCSATRP